MHNQKPPVKQKHDWLEQSPCCSFPEIHVTSSVMLFFPMPRFPGDCPPSNSQMKLGPVPFGGINNMAIEILIFNNEILQKVHFLLPYLLTRGYLGELEYFTHPPNKNMGLFELITMIT